MNRILQSSWSVVAAGALLYLGVTAALMTPGKLAGLCPLQTGPVSADDDPSWKFKNPELDQWVAQIKAEQDALALREKQLTDWQNRLAAEGQEISVVTQTVAQLQENFDRDVVRLRAQEMENIKRQAKLISTMSPEGAVALLDQMPDDDVVRLLFTMKTDVASAILDTMSKQGEADARHAADLTIRLRQVLPSATNAFTAASSP
jgi:flagellar motility protein MotE (MotC chaperone)